MKARLGADKVFDFTLGSPTWSRGPAPRRPWWRWPGTRNPGLHSYMTNAGLLPARQALAGH